MRIPEGIAETAEVEAPAILGAFIAWAAARAPVDLGVVAAGFLQPAADWRNVTSTSEGGDEGARDD